jgi:hypothetical protein
MLTGWALPASPWAGTLSKAVLAIRLSADSFYPVPAGPVPGGSMTVWIWLVVVLAVIVVGGFVLSSRR